MPKEVKDYLVLEGKMELAHAIFELFKKCSPGGQAERKMLLDRIQRPLQLDKEGHEIQVKDSPGVLVALKRWMDKIQRVKDMPLVSMPDPALLWDALKKIINPAVDLDPDLAHELR